MIGQSLGRYRILEKIGQGGMGIVYRAHDERLDRDVALKVLPQGALSDEHARNRFQKEAITLAKLSHPNIAIVHDFDSQEGTDFLVIEYVPGETLSETLTEGPLSEHEIGELGTQLCDGLAAAHLRGVIHRDLKPANLRITPDGKLKILDFGLARLLKPAGETDLTQSVSQDQGLAGTIPYMSPEQLRGEPLDARSDIYSVGVVLYEMATGHRPYRQMHSPELISAILHDTPVAPSSLNHQISSQLDAIIFKTIDKNPQKRYQTANELSGGLGRVGLPEPISNLRKMNLKFRPWPVLAALALAIVICLLVFGLGWTPRKLLPRMKSDATTKVGSVPVAPEDRNIAILPFVVTDNAPIQYLAVGLRESLYYELIRLSEVRLSSLGAIDGAMLRVPGAPPLKLARDVGSRLALSGSVKKSEEEISVSLSLDDAATAKRVWTSDFSGSKNELFQLDNKMLAGVVSALNLKLTSAELSSITSRPTVDPHAYELYLRGRVAARDGDPESALEFYIQAMQKDPKFALAYTHLADAFLYMYTEKKDNIWAEKALGAAQRAEQLNDDLPEVHFSLGGAYAATRKTSQAIAEMKAGLELAPNSDQGYLRLGNLYLEIGQQQNAISQFKKAIEVNPFYWVPHRDLGRAYYSIGEDENAVAEFRRVTELQPDNVEGWSNLATATLRIDNLQGAIEGYQKSIQLVPSSLAYMNLGYVYTVSKEYPKAIEALEKAVELSPSDESARGNLADAYRYSGQKEKADATYDKAIALASHELKVNPRDAATMGDLATYYAKKGDPKRAAEFIRRARAIDKTDVALIYSQAIVENLDGKPSNAISALREALSKGYSLRATTVDYDLQSLQNQPEFEQLWDEYVRKTK
jgi:serine/threonine protein kinase/tetratricopeptide (TPR) repeat protein